MAQHDSASQPTLAPPPKLAGDREKSATERYLQCMALEQRWINVWPQCVAKAWANEDFRERLLNADSEETRRIFKEEFDYDILDHLDMTIRARDNAPASGRHPTDGELVEFVDHTPSIEMTMYLPPTPADPRLQARALAHHTEASQIYPFTTW